MAGRALVIDGRRFDASGAAVRVLGGGGEPSGKERGRIGPSRPAGEAIPEAVARVGYTLDPDDDRRIRSIWLIPHQGADWRRSCRRLAASP